MARSDVLIVGAGPTGLVLALWLNKFGVSVRIVDQTARAGTTSRALAVHARTLELYRQLDLTDAVLKRGHQVPLINLWVRGKKEAQISFDMVGETLTPYPFLHVFPQDEHEQLLIERLHAVGVEVERRCEFLGFDEVGDHILARLRNAEGDEQLHEAAFIAGCDGARSVVRTVMGSGFPGGTYRQVFYVADIEGTGPAVDGALHIDLDEADFLAVFPMADTARVRLIGTVRDERAEHAEELKFEDVSGRAIEQLKVQVSKVNWFSTYRVHHRVTDHFRLGRAFLLGDAAHIHSPAGGQGMNTGIGDAINLAWKLSMVLKGNAPSQLLDSYEIERKAFARRLVKTTDRLFNFATADGAVAKLVRTRLVPVVLPAAVKVNAWREWMFRTVSQLALNYRLSPLSEGRAGRIRGGDRLPWIRTVDADNYTALTVMIWQLHVYGAANRALTDWCQARGLALHQFTWRAEHAAAGIEENSMYLIRPDTYIAYAGDANSIDSLQHYVLQRRMSI